MSNDGLTPFIRRPGLSEDDDLKKKMSKATNKVKAGKKMAPKGDTYTPPKEGFGVKELMSTAQTVKIGKKGVDTVSTAVAAKDAAKAVTATKAAQSAKKLADAKKAKEIAGMKGAGTAVQMGLDALGVGGEHDYSTTGNAASGAAAGFNAGMMTGNPYVAIGGAIVGGVSGIVGAGDKRKAAEAKAKNEAKAQHAGKMVSILGEKEQKIQGAMTRMGAAFSKNLNKEEKVKL